MDDMLNIVVTISLACFGWWITHRMTSMREFNSQKRNICLNFLIGAYRNLESVANSRINHDNNSDKFHSAIADIQLFGSPEQTEKAKQIALLLSTEPAQPEVINDLLVSLRKELRSELNLPEVGNEIVSLRYPKELKYSTS